MAVDATMTLTTSPDSGLLFKSMEGSEELGHLFEFNVEALAESGAIKPEDLLGKPASVALTLPSGTQRQFHGLVCAMGTEGANGRMFRYRLVLRPWLWLLTRRTDTRVFQDMTVQDILKKVFDAFSPDYEFQLKGSYPKYEYCVQYRESDFNFVSRLMEQEGIYYFFRHQSDKHTMVIVDSPSVHKAYPTQEKFEFRESVDGQLNFEPITEWRAVEEIQTGQVVLRDFDFKQPGAALEATAKAARPGVSSTLEVYDYPGSYPSKAEGVRYSRLRLEELQARYTRVTGSGAIRGLTCGYLFDLASHPRDEQNRSHLVTSTKYQMAHRGYESGVDETFCVCQFTAIDGRETFRPRRETPKPVVSGLHTAIVVGPSGEEIYTEEHGRVKVQFHWDRIGKSDESSSCWVRVSTPWAGQNWGMISLPRIGQEVVVDFLEGDPDRPLITGSVYNGKQRPPYTLPDNATVSTGRSRSSKGGAISNFNELRFEDKKGKEYVWLQAEKDFHQFVKNDATLLVDGNQERIIRKDLTDQIDGEVWTGIGKNNVMEVTGSHSLKVTENMTTEVTGAISQKTDSDIGIKAVGDISADAGGTVYIKAMADIVIESSSKITLKVGGSSVVVGPAGVDVVSSALVNIKGSLVNINTGGGAGPGAGKAVRLKAKSQLTKPKKKVDPLNN